MTTTLSRPKRRLRSLSPFWNSPIDKFFGSDFPDFLSSEITQTVPSLNLKEVQDNYILELAAPGLKKDDFVINTEGNILTISCDRETETKEEENDFSIREYNYDNFTRSVNLPDYADSDKISAKYSDGILTLTIPQKPEAKRVSSQKIKVQ